jgi:hypothetical protein
MWDNAAGFCGVAASIFTGVLCQSQAPLLEGWENVGAMGILAMTMYFMLTRINARIDALTDTIHELTTEVKLLHAESDEEK